MYKQSPSRNNRSKGFKAKHILQICLLLAVCFWLIYQVKRSHDKKEEFDTESEKSVGKVQSDADIPRLGRKDLPIITEIDTEEHSLDDEEDNKHEDDEQDIEDNISDDKEDEIDANDLEKAEAETEHEDEINKSEQEAEKADTEGGSVDNKTDNEEIDDVEDEDRSLEAEEHEEAKEDHSQGEEVEDGSKLEEQAHDGDSSNTHEAREEQYKADDASSEVAHDNQTIMPEIRNATVEHTNETITSNMEYMGLQPKNDSVLSHNGTIEDGSGSGNENLTMVENISEHNNKSEGMDDENQLQVVAGSNNTENVSTHMAESLLSEETSSLVVNMNDTNTMSAEGGALEDEETVDSEEGANVIPHDPIDASDTMLTQDEKDSRMDLDTLPEITTENQSNDEVMRE